MIRFKTNETTGAWASRTREGQTSEIGAFEVDF